MLPQKEPPHDQWNLVYFIMLLHGIGCLMPWNMFITIAPSYFVGYKLLETGPEGKLHDTAYSLNFFSYLGICSQIPNLVMNLFNIFIQIKGGLGLRVKISLIIVGIICVITTAMVPVDTSSAVTAFFFFTMFSVVLLNAANGIYQNSIYGIAAAFPPRFTNSIVLGNNVCGTFVSIINIITLAASKTVEMAAIAYFLISAFTICLCLITFFILPRFELYTYFVDNTDNEKDEIDLDQSEQSSPTKKLKEYSNVFKQIWIQCFNVFLVFFVSLTIFPAIMADVQLYRKDGIYDFWIPEKYFTPVTTFLFFNLFAMLGSLLANFIQWPTPKYLWIATVSRIIFIPIMIFCNYRSYHRTWPVLITNEYIYIIAVIIMSFTSGYFSSLAMMYAPKFVESSKAATAGMMSAFFLICGVCGGISFTFVVSAFVDYAGPIPRLPEAGI